jgi:hypothetical protein
MNVSGFRSDIPVCQPAGAALPDLDLNDGASVSEFACACLKEGRAEELNRRCSENGITQLNLEGRQIGPDGPKALGQFLKMNKTVLVLDLTSASVAPNENEETPPGKEGAGAIASGLRENTSLENLRLGGWHIGNEGVALIANALDGNHILKNLSLEANKVDRNAIASVLQILGASGVEALDLSLNHLDPQVRQEIAGHAKRTDVAVAMDRNKPIFPTTQVEGTPSRTYEELVQFTRTGALPKDDTSVLELIQTCIVIDAKDAIAWLNAALMVDKREALCAHTHWVAPHLVADWLNTGPHIKSLTFECFFLEDIVGVHLAIVLEKNSHLHELHITVHDYGGMSLAVARALAEMLKTNTTLLHLTIVNAQEPDLPSEASAYVSEIESALERNRAAAKAAASAEKAGEAIRALSSPEAYQAARWLPVELAGLVTEPIVKLSKSANEANGTLAVVTYFAFQPPAPLPQQPAAAVPGETPQTTDAPGPAR